MVVALCLNCSRAGSVSFEGYSNTTDRQSDQRLSCELLPVEGQTDGATLAAVNQAVRLARYLVAR